MKPQAICGRIITVRDGHPVCPYCRKKMTPKILEETVGKNVVAYCRNCKTEIKLDIDKGQCFESRGQ